MADSPKKLSVLSLLKAGAQPLSLSELTHLSQNTVPERTLRRWLAQWSKGGLIERSGRGSLTVYSWCQSAEVESKPTFAFLQGLDNDLQSGLLGQIRDLWTHTSTALEGNTLTLGDTHFILQEGLTVSGKPMREHQEVLGHAKAIDLIYQTITQPVSEGFLFELHKAVQTEQVTDIYKPNGAWKNEVNGTYAIYDNKHVFIEYSYPQDVAVLMSETIDFVNSVDLNALTLESAHNIYAKIHMAVVHVHPFWDGNGRIARLLSNIPLLKAGLPPLVIQTESRRTYIQALSQYQIDIGQLTKSSGVWPDERKLADFENVCGQSYAATKAQVDSAFEVQSQRKNVYC